MKLLAAVGLLVVVSFGSEAAPSDGDGSMTGYSADVSEPQVDDNKKCHKTVTVSGPGINDKLDEDCDMDSYVIAGSDSLVVGDRIYSDKANQLVVVKDGKCELRTYKDGAYQSSSEMSSEDCDKVKKALSDAKSQAEGWSGQGGEGGQGGGEGGQGGGEGGQGGGEGGSWGGEGGGWGGEGGNWGGEGGNWGGEGGSWGGEGGNWGGAGGNWGGEGGNWGGDGGSWGGGGGNWGGQGGSGGWGYGYGSGDGTPNGGWGFGSGYGGPGNFGGNMVNAAQQHAQQMEKILDGYRSMFNNPGMNFQRPPW
ncbi:hypothetical protein J6590_025242 [Homalodisca vitripennis]|nr:hypothetical protein J6590_025242 [Homalodisca vitripennis]